MSQKLKKLKKKNKRGMQKSRTKNTLNKMKSKYLYQRNMKGRRRFKKINIKSTNNPHQTVNPHLPLNQNQAHPLMKKNHIRVMILDQEGRKREMLRKAKRKKRKTLNIIMTAKVKNMIIRTNITR